MRESRESGHVIKDLIYQVQAVEVVEDLRSEVVAEVADPHSVADPEVVDLNSGEDPEMEVHHSAVEVEGHHLVAALVVHIFYISISMQKYLKCTTVFVSAFLFLFFTFVVRVI